MINCTNTGKSIHGSNKKEKLDKAETICTKETI